ncbi:MAG TPA: hypothetical protein VF629_09350 [Hymenobacter sp.]|uniref:hypothetical protein n=1 Tax=Hymenobacter sp. TaxID=1898978 RepID=UPI002EDAB251
MHALYLLRHWRQMLPLVLGACLAATSAHAQPKNLPDPIKFGQVDNKDLTAAAAVLCDYGITRLEGHGEGFQVVFERVTRIFLKDQMKALAALHPDPAARGAAPCASSSWPACAITAPTAIPARCRCARPTTRTAAPRPT